MAAEAERQYKRVLPFVGMVAMECSNVGTNTLFKAATLQGMSYHVFVVYSHALAALLLFPSTFFFFFNRRRSANSIPSLNFSILSRIFLLGLIGCTCQIMGYTGISYSSPTLSSAIGNLVPAFTFILAILLRMEKLSFRSRSSRAKVLGTILSISGALVVTLYKGPRITLTTTPSSYTIRIPPPIHRAQSNWVLGGLFFTAEYLLYPIWYIVQAQIMKEYPSELTVVFFYNLYVGILAAIVAIFTEPNLSRWKIRTDIALASIICSGIFDSFLKNTIHTWVLRLKGPVYVAMFKPLSIAIAVAMGVIILGDTLFLGSILGATVIAIGFYTVMWGKAKEEMEEIDESNILETSANNKLPLLQNYKK